MFDITRLFKHLFILDDTEFFDMHINLYYNIFLNTLVILSYILNNNVKLIQFRKFLENKLEK